MRRPTAALALAGALLLTGCDEVTQPGDISQPEPTTTITVDSAGCHEGSALSHCQ